MSGWECVVTVGGRSWQQWVPPWARRMVGQESGLWRRIANGAFWSIAGTGIMNALTMATSVGCARLLGSTRFGELALLLSTVSLFLVVTSGGLGMTASRYIAEHRNSDPARAGRIIGLCSAVAFVAGGVVAGVCLFSAPWLSRQVLNAPSLAGGLGIAGAVLFFAAINASQTGILAGLEAFRIIAVGNVIRGVGLVLLGTAGAALFGLSGALWGYAGAGAAAAIYYQAAIRRDCMSRAIQVVYRFDRDEIRVLYRFTLPVVLTSLSFTPAAWWCNVLLARKAGYAEVGVFNTVFQLQMVVLFFSNAVANIGLPTLSNVLAEGDAGKYKRCLAINSLVTLTPAVAVAAPVALAARPIMGLYGPTFQHGAPAAVLMAIGAVITAINIPIGHAIWSLEEAAPGILLSLFRGGTLLIATYALAGAGAVGLAGAYVIMAVLQTIFGLPWAAWLVHRRFLGARTTAAARVSWAAR